MTTALQPLSVTNRDKSLDVLRGFAMAGVLFMFCVNDIGVAPTYTNSFWDETISWAKWVLIESRMYTMLITIFGIGFYVQLEKANQKGVSLVPPFLRRLLGLLIIGFIHAILLSKRDILMFYGMAGFVLLLMRNFSNRQLIISMLLGLFILVTPLSQMLLGSPWKQAHTLVQPNDYSHHLQYNWAYFKLAHQGYAIYLEMLLHFMFGFWIAKTGIFKKIKSNKILRRNLLTISLVASIVLIPVYYFWMNDFFPEIIAKMNYRWQQFLAVSSIGFVWQLWLMVSITVYGSILIGFSVSKKENKWLNPLSAFGQMAMSNYLIQSLVLVPYLLVFNKYLDMPPTNGLLLFFIVFAFELIISTWWMARYSLGPFEWLLRSVTYRKWQPIKRLSEKQFNEKKQLITISTI